MTLQGGNRESVLLPSFVSWCLQLSPRGLEGQSLVDAGRRGQPPRAQILVEKVGRNLKGNQRVFSTSSFRFLNNFTSRWRCQECIGAALFPYMFSLGTGRHGKLLSLCYGGFVILLVIGSFLFFFFFSDAFKPSVLGFFPRSVLFVCLSLQGHFERFHYAS